MLLTPQKFLFFVFLKVKPINNKAIMISQLPTESPIFTDSPTKSSSKGLIVLLIVKFLIHENLFHFTRLFIVIFIVNAAKLD